MKIQKKVNVGVLKNELSKYLRYVQEGSTVLVCDRNQPIAEIIPLQNSEENSWLDEQIRLGRISKRISTGKSFKIPGLNRTIDMDTLHRILDEERDDRF